MSAAIAQPTWAEVQTIPVFELEAINIIKGEMAGDEFLWEASYYDPKLGREVTGVWKSQLEKRKERAGPEGRATN